MQEAKELKLTVKGQSGSTVDITQLVQNVTLSGSYKNTCRQLGFSLVSGGDNVPLVDAPLGGGVTLTAGGEELFSGTILTRTRESLSPAVDIVAYDWGYWLKQSKTYYKCSGQTPEAAVAALASGLGLSVGSLAKTDVAVTQSFLPGDYYTIFSKLYYLAGAKTGKKYRLDIVSGKLTVSAWEDNAARVILRPGDNLLWAKTSEDLLSGYTNRVAVYDSSYNQTAVYERASEQALYGVFQTAVLASKYDDAAAEAKQELADGELTSNIVINCTGDTRLKTGRMCIVQEPITNTYGKFYIVSDTHSWSKGNYTTKLSVSLKDLVSEAEAKRYEDDEED